MTADTHRQWPDFTPKGDVLALLPDARGNDINGLGEDTVRRPSPIMWHSPDILAHGDLQSWFFAHANAPGATEHRLKSMEFMKQPLAGLAETRPDWSPEEWTSKVKQAALSREADQVGIAEMNPDWVFEGYEAPYKWMIVIAVAMDYECLKTAPSEKSQTEVQNQYARGTRAAYKLAGWLREQGWEAHPHGGPMAGPVLIIPAAIQAGLGELGKHGSMINRQFGSAFRLACVLTDAPLIADRPDEIGIDDFCTNCQVCSRACPVDAIYAEKQPVRGDRKWYVDFDDCILYFVENNGCGACIGQCPWSRPGTSPRLADKLARRRE